MGHQQLRPMGRGTGQTVGQNHFGRTDGRNPAAAARRVHRTPHPPLPPRQLRSGRHLRYFVGERPSETAKHRTAGLIDRTCAIQAV